MNTERLPAGFMAAGLNVGIKSRKKDLGLLFCERPAVMAACVTQNKSRAPCTQRLEQLRGSARPVRAVLALSGNANALTGAEGARDDVRLAEEMAKGLGVQAQEVLTMCTGVIGHRLPMERVLSGYERLRAELSDDPLHLAQSVMTTDQVTKIESRELFLSGKRVRLVAVAKGSGMVAPSLATTLALICTDAQIEQPLLQAALASALDRTINQLCVDGGMSTNDAFVALASGASSAVIEADSKDYALFADGLLDLLTSIARKIAQDGEGATRMIQALVCEARTEAEARSLSRAIVGSDLVKAAVFGADPNAQGRIMAALGGAAHLCEAGYALEQVELRIQGQTVVRDGVFCDIEPAQLRLKMTEPEVQIEARLGQGVAQAFAWGCDLSYDYVKINADYAAVTEASVDGRVGVDGRLDRMGPSLKKKLLIEALRYIDRFMGMIAVIKVGGAAMIDPKLSARFAEDVLLLKAVGLRPVVVHEGGVEIERTLAQRSDTPGFLSGVQALGSAEIMRMVLTERVNQHLVAALNEGGRAAVGLSGKDGGLLTVRSSLAVDTALIDLLEKGGYIPVISPVGLGPEGPYALEADRVAASIAQAFKARKLLFLGDTPGLMEGEHLITELSADQLKARVDGGAHHLSAALGALVGGVASVHLVDGRVPHNLIAELFTDRGVGTIVRGQ